NTAKNTIPLRVFPSISRPRLYVVIERSSGASRRPVPLHARVTRTRTCARARSRREKGGGRCCRHAVGWYPAEAFTRVGPSAAASRRPVPLRARVTRTRTCAYAYAHVRESQKRAPGRRVASRRVSRLAGWVARPLSAKRRGA